MPPVMHSEDRGVTHSDEQKWWAEASAAASRLRDDHWFTIEEISDQLSFSEKVLRHAVEDEELEAHIFRGPLGVLPKVKAEHLKAWLRKRGYAVVSRAAYLQIVKELEAE